MTEAAPSSSWLDRPALVVGLCTLAYLPFTLLGYGTDIDVANVLRAGRSWLDDGDYQLSRGPGAAVHELATAALDRVGGSVLVNLASVALAAVILWAVHELVRRDGARHPSWVVVVLASNPWFWIAATSLGDFVWALAAVLAGAVAAQRDRRLLAGLLFGLSIACRASSVLLVAGWLIAERISRVTAGDRTGGDAEIPPGTERERSGGADLEVRPWWPKSIATAGVAVAVAILCFVPPWLDANRTFGFLDNELEFAGVGVHLGRWLVKNLAVIGIPAGAVLLVGARHLQRALARWRTSTLVRFAALSIVLVELLFYRLPFKPLHLLPVVVAAVLLIGASPTVTRRWLAALVVAQLIGGLVGTTLAAPDVEDDAQSGQVDLGITAGPLLTDVRCRFDDRDRGPWPKASDPAANLRAEENAACQNQTWRAG